MNLSINPRQALGAVVAVAGAAAVITAAVQGDGGGRLIQFGLTLATFAVQCIGITAVALLVVYITQWIRNRTWFDERGCAREMALINARIGQDSGQLAEHPNDNVAVAIAYAGTTALIAIVVLAFFLIHG